MTEESVFENLFEKIGDEIMPSNKQ